jgi:flagellin-like hook-associated protein FlgL
VNEIQSLANGADANGNYLFGGTRTKTQPYQQIPLVSSDIMGDQVETSVNLTDTRTLKLVDLDPMSISRLIQGIF